MELGILAVVVVVGFALRRLFTPRRSALEVALEHIANGAPVRAEHVAEGALRAARRPADRAQAQVVLARVLMETGDLERAGAALDEALAYFREAGDAEALARATEMRAVIEEARALAPAPDDDLTAVEASVRRALMGDATAVAATAPAIADRCASGGCGCGPAGELDADASRAMAELLQQSRAAGLVRAAEVRREGDRLVPRVTLVGELSPEEERTVERAVEGAMRTLFG